MTVPRLRNFQPHPDFPLRSYKVLLEGRDHGDRRHTIVVKAIGPKDAKNQAEDGWPTYCALAAEPLEVTWDDLKAQGLSEGELREWSGK